MSLPIAVGRVFIAGIMLMVQPVKLRTGELSQSGNGG
jgi:hypothetical protein